MHSELSYQRLTSGEKVRLIRTVAFVRDSICTIKPKILHSQMISFSNTVISLEQQVRAKSCNFAQKLLSLKKKKKAIHRDLNHWNSCCLFIHQSDTKSTCNYH